MNTMDDVPPFSDQEKRFILAEAIKTSSVPIERVLYLFNDGIIEPSWNMMQIPFGRNLASCFHTFEMLRAGPRHLPTFHSQSFSGSMAVARPTTKRKSIADDLEPVVSSAKRPRSDLTQHVLLKPSTGSPESNPSPSTIQPMPQGCPTKADVEQRQAAAIARGDIIALPKPATPMSEALPVGESARTPLYAAIAPMLPPRPPAWPMTPTTFVDSEADSTGKKKRANPAPRAPKLPKPREQTCSVMNTQFKELESPRNPLVASNSTEPAPVSQPESSIVPVRPTEALASQISPLMGPTLPPILPGKYFNLVLP